MDQSVLARKQLVELKNIAAHLQMRGYQRLRKADLIEAIIQAANGGNAGPPSEGGGQEQEGGSDRPIVDVALELDEQSRSGLPEPERDADDSTRDQAEPADGLVRTRVRTRARARTRDTDTGVEPQPEIEPEDEVKPEQRQQTHVRARPIEPPRYGGPTARDADARGRQVADDDGFGGNRNKRRSRRERRRSSSKSDVRPQQAQRVRERDDDASGEPGEVRTGVLDVLPEGYGFLRTSGYLPGDRDVYISQGQIRKYGLRRGDVIEGPIRAQRHNEKVPALHQVLKANGISPDENGHLPHRPDFKDMTPLFPQERLRLESPDGPISMRIIDLIAPIGKGQRGLIVSPPKAGKTTILKELGQAIAFNNPECHLMVVLVDERPEEVTDMSRSIPGEVIASTFDRPADDHTQIAELAMERAKRLVEFGHDVVVLLDSITRLARAYNLSAPASGRIMSGGVDSTALYPPKRFFGAARNLEGGGSLTIIASALIETGSKMDEVIFEEFKGTGNMELRLDRRLEQKRIFPAIDIEASSTRKEELLFDKEELMIIWKLRRVLHALEGPAAVELLIDRIRSTRSNNQFLVQIQKSNLQT
ncbi:MAG: transcription termination factor Rho [Egibacteraceae bacterium]